LFVVCLFASLVASSLLSFATWFIIFGHSSQLKHYWETVFLRKTPFSVILVEVATQLVLPEPNTRGFFSIVDTAMEMHLRVLIFFLLVAVVVTALQRTLMVGVRGGLCELPRAAHAARQVKLFLIDDKSVETLLNLSQNPSTVPVAVGAVLAWLLYSGQKSLEGELKEMEVAKRFESLRKDMKEEFKAVAGRFDSLDRRMDGSSAFMGATVAVLVALSVAVTVAALRPSLAGGLPPGL
jgi:hypothetical protein